MKKVFLCLALAGLSACSGGTNQAGDPSTRIVAVQGVPLDSSLVVVAQQSLAILMRDPSSVQFGSTRAAIFTYADSSQRLAACGVYNAKNGYGAYVGQKEYLALFDTATGGADAVPDARLLCQQYGFSNF